MQNTLPYYFARLYKQFLSYSTQRLQKQGLGYGSLPFILYIGRHPGCTQAQMTGELHLDWGHCQRSVTRLVQDGFITKEKAAADARAYHLNLTAAGCQAFEISHQVFFDWQAQQVTKLTQEEQAQLTALLTKLLPDASTQNNKEEIR